MDIPNQVLSFIQYSPTIDKMEVQVIPLEFDWMMPIISYLRDGTLLEDCNVSRRLKVQSSHFVMVADVLYKRGFSHPYMRYLTLDEADYVMREVRKKVYGNHSVACLLVHKMIRAGYY